MYACLGVTCHLSFCQNDRGLLRATAVTGGWNEHQIRVSRQSELWRRKFSRRSCRDSNSQPFDYESSALTNKLSRLSGGAGRDNDDSEDDALNDRFFGGRVGNAEGSEWGESGQVQYLLLVSS